MRDSGKVAIGRVVLRSRQQLVAIHPREDVLMMTTLNFADEIQPASELDELREAAEVQLGAQELDIAHRLVESVARPFDPANYHDTYREALLELIDRKAGGEQVVLEPPAAEQPLQALDLMSALEASIEQVRAQREAAGAPAPKRKRSKVAAKGNGVPADDGAPAEGNGAPGKRGAAPAKKARGKART